MKKKVLAGLICAGILGISGAAFADVNINVNLDRTVAKTQTEKQRPPMPPKLSRDVKGQNRPPEPPDGKRPPMSGDKKFENGKRPPKPRSDDRRPPKFEDDGRPQPQMKKGSK